MKWIILFAKNKIPYYIYKLSAEDKIILNSTNNQKKAIIVIDGIVIVTKIFHNKTKLPLAILEKNSLFINQDNKKRFYYEVKAMSNSYILIMHKKIFEQKKIRNNTSIIQTHYQTIDKYEETIMMVNEKSSKKRIILLILLVFIKFGYIHRNKVIISFILSEKNIAVITNTSISAVNKTINNLDKININKKKNKRIQTLTIKK